MSTDAAVIVLLVCLAASIVGTLLADDRLFIITVALLVGLVVTVHVADHRQREACAAVGGVTISGECVDRSVILNPKGAGQ